MIQSRRKAHFFSSVVLVCLLPIIFIAGILGRPKIPPVTDSRVFEQAGFIPPENSEKVPIAAEELIAAEVPIKAQTLQQQNQLFLELEPTSALLFPDLLLYWQSGEELPTDLTTSSILLGSLSGTSRRRFPIIQEMQGQEGYLILYSLGDKKLVATLPLPASMTQKPN